ESDRIDSDERMIIQKPTGERLLKSNSKYHNQKNYQLKPVPRTVSRKVLSGGRNPPVYT
ncbi:hypothetical protein PIB30_100769, partial [Stylosanthes scabra]|nr:hypothetical protein [Stylosanthes scabra]